MKEVICDEEEGLAMRVRIVSKLTTTQFAVCFTSRDGGSFPDGNLTSAPIDWKSVSDLYSRIRISYSYFL
jgi:hypothetical protein